MYAGLFENLHQAQQAVKAANDKLSKAKSAKEKTQAQNDLTKHQQDVQSLQTQMDLIPTAIQKAMNLKH